MVKATAATVADAARLFAWRNDRVTREHSHSDAFVPWKTHLEWLAKVIADPNIELYVARDVERSVYVGTFRIDIDDESSVVSVTVDPQQRGRGYAREMVQLAIEMHKGRLLIAQVNEQNIASLRTFWSLGFSGGSVEKGVITLERKG